MVSECLLKVKLYAHMTQVNWHSGPITVSNVNSLEEARNNIHSSDFYISI